MVLWVLVAIATPIPGDSRLAGRGSGFRRGYSPALYRGAATPDRIEPNKCLTQCTRIQARSSGTVGRLRWGPAPGADCRLRQWMRPRNRTTCRSTAEWDPRSARTYLLVGINVAVFLWMVCTGVSATLPNDAQLQRFGANSADLVLIHENGEWYRLLTATFVHMRMHSHRHEHVVPLEPGPAGRATARAPWALSPSSPDRGRRQSAFGSGSRSLLPSHAHSGQYRDGRRSFRRGLRHRRDPDRAAFEPQAPDPMVRAASVCGTSVVVCAPSTSSSAHRPS